MPVLCEALFWSQFLFLLRPNINASLKSSKRIVRSILYHDSSVSASPSNTVHVPAPEIDPHRLYNFWCGVDESLLFGITRTRASKLQLEDATHHSPHRVVSGFEMIHYMML